MEATLEIRPEISFLNGKYLSIETIPIYKKFPLKPPFLLQRNHYLKLHFSFQKRHFFFSKSFLQLIRLFSKANVKFFQITIPFWKKKQFFLNINI